MSYFTLLMILLFFFGGGPIISVLSAAGGIIMIFYLAFKWGPKLSLIAIPVVICFFLCMWLDDFALMYAKHMLKLVIIGLIITLIFCKYYFEEDYKGIVIGITAGITAVTLIVLAVWMYVPKDFSVPNRTDRIEIQQMRESIQVVYTDPNEFGELLDRLERVEMCGTFEELTDFKGIGNTYRLTFRNKNGKDIGTYYFLSKYYVAKPVGKHYIFYRWTEDSTFPYNQLVGMHERVK